MYAQSLVQERHNASNKKNITWTNNKDENMNINTEVKQH